MNSNIENIVNHLKEINVDGETMQYILDKTGMEEQMFKQLNNKFSQQKKSIQIKNNGNLSAISFEKLQRLISFYQSENKNYLQVIIDSTNDITADEYCQELQENLSEELNSKYYKSLNFRQLINDLTLVKSKKEIKEHLIKLIKN